MINTDPYKGVRDFFPEDMSVENKIFAIWRDTVRRYGYEEYSASVLEPAELYKAKSGEEIVNEQTYTFKDRGDREVTLRPEMTPTLARMIAKKKRELTFPVRWFSIPNLFRYEQPQRGRVREHWQLNVDIFGLNTIFAEVEVINIAYDIVKQYGLKDSDFEIRLNNRKIMNYITKEVFGLEEEKSNKLSKLVDKKDKLSKEAFEETAKLIFSKKEDLENFLVLINSGNFEEFASRLPQSKQEHEGIKELKSVMSALEKVGIKNYRFDQSLMRGFDYYTGTVFEIFDKNPANRRAVLGGGRYDDLLSIFGNEKVSAVGFGMGDVVARDLMETYGTLGQKDSVADFAILTLSEECIPFAMDTANMLRNKMLKIFVDMSEKKLGDKIANADKRNIGKVICIGEEEIKTGKLRIKDLKTGEETILKEAEL